MSRGSEREERGFLSRWSQRKQRSRDGTPPAEPLEEAPAAEALAASEDAAGDPERLTEEQIAPLPDPDSLQAGDDFKPFLQRGVPEILKRRALRRLWSVNPLFNLRDGLNEYDEDYTDAATVVANLKTLFQPGKGMPQPERWQKPEAPPEEAPEAGPPAAAEASGAEQTDGAPEGPEAEREPSQAMAAGAEASPGAGKEAEATGAESAGAGKPAPPPPGRLRRPAAQRRWHAFAVEEKESDDVQQKR